MFVLYTQRLHTSDAERLPTGAMQGPTLLPGPLAVSAACVAILAGGWGLGGEWRAASHADASIHTYMFSAFSFSSDFGQLCDACMREQ